MSPAALALLLGLSPAQAGELLLVLFVDGAPPPAGVQVSAGAQTVTVDADGAARLSALSGPQALQLRGPAGEAWASATLTVAPEGRTEALLSLSAAGALLGLTVDGAAAPAAGPAPVESGPMATVSGRVLDGRGAPVADVRVFARGAPSEVTTGPDGRWSLSVPAGPLQVSALKPGWALRQPPPTELLPGEARTLDLSMVDAGVTLAAFTVSAPRIEGGTAALLGERQESAQVVDTLSAEEMGRRGDSSAAAALRRVTGVTVVGGRYVYVRGLGERYSTTLLNGAMIPSPEPERRVVPLDLFPTSMLESVVVQKTASPDRPGEFGGGVVELRTRGIPEEPLLRVNVSGAYNTVTTGRTGLMPGGQSGDLWASGAAARDLPQAFASAVEDTPLVLKSALPNAQGFDAETLAELGASLPNTWGLEPTVAGFNRGFGVEAGRGWNIGDDLRIGGLGGLIYRDTWRRASYRDVYYRQNSGKLEIQNDYQFTDLGRTVQVGGMAVAQIAYKDTHDVRATALRTRDGESVGRRYVGYYDEVGADIRGERGQYVERQLSLLQGTGDHRFPALWDSTVRWRWTDSWAERAEPDRRDILMERASAGGWRMRNQGGGNAMFFSDLADFGKDRGVDLRVPLRGKAQGTPWATELMAGWARVYRDREVDTRRFVYNVQTAGQAGATDFLTGEPAEIFDRENIDSGALRVAEATTATDNYTAVQIVKAGYLGATMTLPKGLSASGGVRVEDSAQQVVTYQLFTAEPQKEIATLATLDVLPSGTLTWRLTQEEATRPAYLRGGYGRTLNRPDFRELSPAVYNDVAGGREIAGNTELTRALIDNVDLRLEWFPSPDELLSVGAFAKRFTDPIESNIIVSANSRISYINAAAANNAGVEFEWRKRLAPEAHPMSPLTLSGNAALIRSTVELGEGAGAVTNTERPLQGQSPTTLNLGLSWEPVEGDLSGGLWFNTAGPRISEVGEGGMPDVVTVPARLLDASVSYATIADLTLGLRAQNLLNSPDTLMVGSKVARAIESGRTFTASLSWQPDGEREKPAAR
ncbi:MAG: TonB-dependent receptor [Deltaproteobacteria bacterium]|nr:TonB-dependent receptor [Deltaproteobacteria bacterium]